MSISKFIHEPIHKNRSIINVISLNLSGSMNESDKNLAKSLHVLMVAVHEVNRAQLRPTCKVIISRAVVDHFTCFLSSLNSYHPKKHKRPHMSTIYSAYVHLYLLITIRAVLNIFFEELAHHLFTYKSITIVSLSYEMPSRISLSSNVYQINILPTTRKA